MTLKSVTPQVTPQVTPLYDHDSEETAYVVDDYPYGRKVRTQIRYWLECDSKRGWRLASQTKNPRTGSWNKPKRSTYSSTAGAMYLDEQGHVQWDSLHDYSSVADYERFFTRFPEAQLGRARARVLAHIKYRQDMLTGKARWVVNGVEQPLTDPQREEYQDELQRFEAIAAQWQKGHEK